uniref:Secreted protein n=1 Tax=Eutreptiella gymnastica TaxID=73025 RepID=A0A6T2G8Q5_9EUGL
MRASRSSVAIALAVVSGLRVHVWSGCSCASVELVFPLSHAQILNPNNSLTESSERRDDCPDEAGECCVQEEISLCVPGGGALDGLCNGSPPPIKSLVLLCVASRAVGSPTQSVLV